MYGGILQPINQSMNMIHDINDSIEKSNSMQQLHPMTSFASVALYLEKNPETLDNISRYISCSMEPGALEISKKLHDRANELRKELYGIGIDDDKTMNAATTLKDQATKIREELKTDEVLQEYYQFYKNQENEEVSKQR